MGVCLRKWKTEGRGTAEIPEVTPPLLGKRRGWGSWALFLDKSAATNLRVFPESSDRTHEVFLKSAAADPRIFRNP